MKGRDPLDLIGKQLLLRYTIRERLAQGGMSVVYRGEDERLRRDVCVKVFFGVDREQALYQTTYEHFVQEAFALSQLQHPNTLRIYDFGYLEEEPRSPFHVSELMTGGTLLSRVRREGLLEPAAALAIVEPVAGALAEAHARGIIHRDIKPSNILFGSAGGQQIVKLADFGIAKATLEDMERSLPHRAQDTNAAGARVSLYSPGWAAPEQLRAQRVSPATDVYSLGLLLAFMLSGRKLFPGEDFRKTLEQRMEGDAFLVAAVAGLALPPALSEVIVRACRTNPAERVGTVDELVELARRAVADPGAAQGSTAPTERFERMPTTPGRREEDLVTLLTLAQPAIDVGGRRLSLVPARDQIDLGGEGDPVTGPARVRVTVLPGAQEGARVHVKGLNCFVARAGGRPSGALDVSADAELDLVTPDRKRADGVRIAFGIDAGPCRRYALAGTALDVPIAEAGWTALFDFGPGRDLILVYAGRRA